MKFTQPTVAFFIMSVLAGFEIQAAIPLNIGTTYSGRIALPGETHIYTFSGTPGGRFYLDTQDADAVSLNLTVTSPTGVQIYQGNDDSDFGPFTLNDSGTYSLVVKGTGSTTGNYQFRLLDLSTAQTLTLGSALSGQLSPPLACNISQFNGTRGQRINLQTVSSSSNLAQWELVSPANVVLASAPINQNLGTVTLPTDGAYCLLISGYSLGTITITPLTFQVLLTDVSDGPASANGFGTVHSGTVNANQTNSFTYTAPAGLPIYFDSLDKSGQSLLVTLVDPTGNAVFTVGETGDSGPYILPRSGTYTLNVWGPNGSSGNFDFRLLDLTASPVLPLNTVVSNNLNLSYQTDVYQFSGTPGQCLFYDSLVSTFANVQVLLLSPDGQNLVAGNQSSDSTAPFTLLYAGNYYFFVQSGLATSTPYGFQLLDVAAQPPLPINSPLTNYLAANESAIYQLAVTNVEQLFFNGESVSAGAFWTLYDPENAYVSGASTSLGGDFEVTLTNPGKYVLVTAAGANSVSFSNFVSTFNYQSNTVSFGTLVSNNIVSPGDQLVYTFTGTAGHRVYFDSLFPAYLPITFNLISPTGLGTVYGNASYDNGPFTLPETGIYTLIFTANGDTTGPIAFQLIEVDTQPPLPLNVDFTGTLTTNAAIIYQLAGTNGELLYFHAKGTSVPGATWTLFDPKNTQIGSANVGADFSPPVVLPYNGNYAVVFSAGGYPGSYSNQVNTFTFTTNALTLGATTTNTIAHPGDQVVCTFNGSPGQRLYYDSLFAAYSTVPVTLLSPSGASVLYGNASYDLGPVTLLESGTYTLQFNGTGNTTGGIYFRLMDIGAQPSLPLDTDLSGTLASNSSIIYQLAGSAGEQLYFNSKGASGSASWLFYAPNNVQIGNSYLGGDFEVTLPYAGDYALVFVGGASDVIYTNQVNTFSYSTNALAFGTVVASTIQKPGDQLYYIFSGTAGQRLYYDSRMTNYINASVSLTSPGGVTSLLGNPTSDKGPFTLTQSGTYALIFSGGGHTTGIISFNLLDLSAATPVTLGTAVTDSLSDQTETRLYQYTGTTGFRLDLQSLTSPTTAATWALIGLQNQDLGPVPYISGNIGIVTFPATGTYTIAVIGDTMSTAPLSYEFMVTGANDLPVAPTGFGVVYSGNVGANQTNTLTFNATAGLPIFFDSQDTSGQNLAVDFVAPDGTTVFTVSEIADAGPYVLPRSGTYTLYVRGYSGASGNYSFRLLDMTTSHALSLNAPTTGSLSNSYQTDIYQFTTSAGQRLMYNALTNDSNYPSVFVQLLDPSGQSVGPNSDFANSSPAPFAIQYAGTSYLFLRNNKSVAGGYYFQMLDVGALPALPLNTTLTNVLGVYAVGMYQFSGNPGQQLYFNGSPGNPAGYWSFYDPNNSAVSGSGSSLIAGFGATLSVAGTYVLVLNNNSGNTAPDIFQVNDFSYFTNSYTLGTAVVDAITRPGERRFYTFTGTAGQQLYYDALTNAPASPNTLTATLLNPASVAEALGGAVANDRGPFTLQNSGLYTVLIDGTGPSVGPFAFRLLDIAAQPAMPVNSPVTNNLDEYAALAYQYAGTAGQQLYFRGQPSNPSGLWSLYDPNNNGVYNGAASLISDFEVTLPTNGTYALVLSSSSTTAGTEVFQVNDFTYFTNSYTLGTVVVDSITRPGERRAYTFTGTIGQTLYYDALTNAPAPPNSITATLLDPQGVAVASISAVGFYADRGPFTLQQSGTYTFVMDGYSSSVGPFAFRLLDISQQPALLLSSLVTNNLDLYTAIVYKYIGTNGEQLYFHAQSANLSGGWTLYDPNDNVVSQANAGLSSDFQAMLPIDGLYALVMVNYGNTTGTQVFEVNPFNFGEPVQINQAPVLTFIPPQITGESAPLLFTAQATDPDGDALTFSLDPGGPAGATINPANGNFSWTPPPTGFSFATNVTVRVTDNGTPHLSAAQTVTISVVSGPVMIGVQKTAASATVFWRSAIGKHYQLYYKNSLEDATWTPIGAVVAATDYTASQVDTTTGNNGTRYYRVQLLDPTP